MRLLLVFVSVSSRVREIVALYLITTTEDEHHAHFPEQLKHLQIVRRAMAKRDSGCGLAARCPTFETISIDRVGPAQIMDIDLHRTKEL
jgi:hypothetical protein